MRSRFLLCLLAIPLATSGPAVAGGNECGGVAVAASVNGYGTERCTDGVRVECYSRFVTTPFGVSVLVEVCVPTVTSPPENTAR